MNAAHGRHLIGDADGVIEGEHDDFGWRAGDSVEDREAMSMGQVEDAELRAAACRALAEKLRLHAVGIG